MRDVEFVYTVGMNEDELEAYLRAGRDGVLALADGNDAYATPLNYHYDGDQLLFRVSDDDEVSEKHRFLETTDAATFVLYDVAENESWSIHVHGPLREWSGTVDEATINEWFAPFRLFDEAIQDVDFRMIEMQIESAIGRRTLHAHPEDRA